MSSQAPVRVRYVPAVHGASQSLCSQRAKPLKSRSSSPQSREVSQTSLPATFKLKESGPAHKDGDMKHQRMRSKSRSASPQPQDASRAAVPVALKVKDDCQAKKDVDIKNKRTQSKSRSTSPRPQDVSRAAVPVALKVKESRHTLKDADIKNQRLQSKSRSTSPRSQDVLRPAVPVPLKVKDVCLALKDADIINQRVRSKSRSASPQLQDALKPAALPTLTLKDLCQPREHGDIQNRRARSRSRTASPPHQAVLQTAAPVNFAVKEVCQPCNDSDIKEMRVQSRLSATPRLPRRQNVLTAAVPAKLHVNDGCCFHSDAQIKNSSEHEKSTSSQNVGPKPQDAKKALLQVTLKVKDVCHAHDDTQFSSLRMRSSTADHSTPSCGACKHGNVLKSRSVSPQLQDGAQVAMSETLQAKGVQRVRSAVDINNFGMRSAAAAHCAPQRVSLKNGNASKSRSVSPMSQDTAKVAMPVTMRMNDVQHVCGDADILNSRMRSRSRSDSPQPHDVVKTAMPMTILCRSRSIGPPNHDVLRAATPVKLNMKGVRRIHQDAGVKPKVPREQMRVFCYGDSNTAGFCSGGTRFEPYARSLQQALLAAGIPCEVSHAGLSGVTAAEMADKVDHSSIRDKCGHEHECLCKLLRNLRPDVVILMVGTNDMGKGAPPLQILQHTFCLHDACHRDGIRTIAVAPPSTNEGPARQCRDQYAALLKQYATMNPNVATFLDAQQLLPRGPGLGFWEPDVIHLSPKGSRALGQHLAPLVIQCNQMSRQSPHALRHGFGGA